MTPSFSLQRFSLQGRRVLITGSSRGIGQALARGMAQAGASVIVSGRDITTLNSVVIPGWVISHRQPSRGTTIEWLLKKEQMVVSAIASTPHKAAALVLVPLLRQSRTESGRYPTHPASERCPSAS